MEPLRDHESPPKKTQDIAEEIAADCVAMRVRSLNRSLTTIYDDAFRPLGITASQVTLLVATVKRADPSPGQLAKILNLEKSTVSRNLERMRKSGWIEIDTSQAGRRHTVVATKSGHNVLERALPLWRDAQEKSCASLGPQGAEKLKNLIERGSSRFKK